MPAADVKIIIKTLHLPRSISLFYSDLFFADLYCSLTPSWRGAAATRFGPVAAAARGPCPGSTTPSPPRPATPAAPRAPRGWRGGGGDLVRARLARADLVTLSSRHAKPGAARPSQVRPSEAARRQREPRGTTRHREPRRNPRARERCSDTRTFRRGPVRRGGRTAAEQRPRGHPQNAVRKLPCGRACGSLAPAGPRLHTPTATRVSWRNPDCGGAGPARRASELERPRSRG